MKTTRREGFSDCFPFRIDTEWSLGGLSFLADWERALMLHYEVDPKELQPFVPFELDVREGKAFVTLVAFTMRGLRPRRGGWLTASIFAPIATHELLNVRTYVRYGGESGIYFLAEWLPNLLSVAMGGLVFGLPYRWGKLVFAHTHELGAVSGEVMAGIGRDKSKDQDACGTVRRFPTILKVAPGDRSLNG